MPRAPAVTNKQLLQAFETLCKKYKVASRGFEPKKITAPLSGKEYDGTPQWAIKHQPSVGYMIVCGLGGCGVVFTRWNGYMRTRWDFLMLIEALTWAKRLPEKGE
mgnify:CR=1 FL=1